MCLAPTNAYDIVQSIFSWTGIIICVVLVIKYKKLKNNDDDVK